MMKSCVACSNNEMIINHETMAFSCDMEIKSLYRSIVGQNLPLKKNNQS
jgi:hypothetical protein